MENTDTDSAPKYSKREMLDFLAAEFEADEHEYVEGLIYIGINPTIRRLNAWSAEFDQPWDFALQTPMIENTGKSTKSGKPIYRATVVGSLSLGGYFVSSLGTRDGSGSAESFDMDTAVKSAQAYALRKAGNLFGVAGYLLSEESRVAAEDRIATETEVSSLKGVLADHAEANGALLDRTPEENALVIAGLHNVTVKELQDINVLRRLVEEL